MNVLLVTLGLPYPPNAGAQVRDFHLLREISRGARVHLLSLLTVEPPPDLSELRRYCASVEMYRPPERGIWDSLAASRGSGAANWPLATRFFYFPELARKISRLVRELDIDLVQIEHSFLACYLDAVRDSPECAAVLSFHNIGSLQYRRMASLQTGLRSRLSFLGKAILMRNWEPHAAARFDRCLVVSSAEGDLLRAGKASLRPEVIDNGVDCERLRPLPDADRDDELLFVGVMGYPPNSDAALYFCREVLPRVREEIPGVLVTFAGHAPPAALRKLDAGNGIRVTGAVEDVIPFYAAAKVAIVPLRAGGGTRHKIIEAMALGRAVVSTSIGAEGLEVEAGRDLLVADRPAEFARAVVTLLRDRELRQRIAANARRLVEQRYDWRRLGGKLLGVYRDVLREKAVRA